MILTLAILVLLVIYVIYIYNRLVKLKNLVNEAWSGIDVQLQKRYDLIPTLVNAIKGYTTHEKNLLEQITVLRNQAINAKDIRSQEQIEISISKTLGSLFVVVESYPELKASQNFLDLQQELSKVENDLQRARRYYNGSTRNYNILIEQFPSMFVAKVFKHEKNEYFDIADETEKNAPHVDF